MKPTSPPESALHAKQVKQVTLRPVKVTQPMVDAAMDTLSQKLADEIIKYMMTLTPEVRERVLRLVTAAIPLIVVTD